MADNRAEDTLGNIAFSRALVEQGLNIGFREHAAARGDCVCLFISLCQLVKLLERNVEQSRHLVDKRSRTAGAGAVHSYLKTVCQEQNLSVLAAQLDYNICAGNKGICGNSGGKNLLHKLNSAVGGNAHSGRARKRNKRIFDAVDFSPYAVKNFRDFIGNLRKMSFICAVNQLVVVIEHNALDCG